MVDRWLIGIGGLVNKVRYLEIVTNLTQKVWTVKNMETDVFLSARNYTL